MTLTRIVLYSALLLAWSAASQAQIAEAPKAKPAPFTPPDDSTVPVGPMGDAIRLGHKILTQTRVYARQYTGNALNCTSCHLNGGRTPYAAPWVGIWGVFPEYRSRNAKVNSLQDRINDCFRRSMNGKPLPFDSDEMRGVLAYMHWLSKNVPTGLDVEGRGFARISAPKPPDAAHGKQVFMDKCAVCHATDGQGKYGAQGETLFPPLWGPNSFNIGAGMARLNTAAAFVKAMMPLGQGGSLSDQEAFDVALYFTQQPRPDFADKALDWPNGDKPKDARY